MAKPTPAPTPVVASNAPAAAAAPTYSYVDLPDLAETFADSIGSTFFDGQTLRIEFCVGRLDSFKPQTSPTGRRYPACRLVLSTAAAVELMNSMQRISAALVKAGVLKPTPVQGGPGESQTDER
jgi:hypothetical protein